MEKFFFKQDKIFFHMDRLSDYCCKGSTFPVTWEIDITNRCNNRCPACAGKNENRVELSTSEAAGYIRQVAALGGRGLIFTGGGEPLVHKGLSDLVQVAYAEKLSVGLITSGQEGPVRHDIAGLMGCEWVRVSLDAGTPAVYRLRHGLGTEKFAAAIDYIVRLVRAKRAANSGTTVGVGYLTGEDTDPIDVEMAIVTAKQAGADYFQLRPLHNSNRNFSAEIAEWQERFSGDGFAVVASMQKYQHMGAAGPTRTYGYCHGADFASVICADAKVYVCCHLRSEERGCIGDLRQRSLAEIWADPRRQEIVRTIDVSGCVPLCRCDQINRTIESLLTDTQPHKNFL